MECLTVVRCAGREGWARETRASLQGPRVAISGGSTYAGLFPEWVAAGIPADVEFFPVDERAVPIDDPASNWGQARRLLFQPLGRTPENFAASASAYHDLLLSNFGAAPVFDSIFLGVGEDGHTASLFPAGPELADQDSIVVETCSPSPPQQRISLGLATLWRARSLIAAVSGETKRTIVERLLQGDTSLPITLALSGHPCPVLILEHSADPRR